MAIGLGALVYNYDGNVFASDEGRMLGETGDNAFKLGHVDQDSYQSLVLSDKLIDLVVAYAMCAGMLDLRVREPLWG